MQSREVFIKADGNGAPVKVNFEGQTFGELKELTSSDVTWENSRVVLKGSQVDLVADDALIPSVGPVMIFVVPLKQKGGVDVSTLGRNDLVSHVKGIIESDGQPAKDHFGNYPIIKTDSLVELVNAYRAAASTSTVDDTTEMDEVRAAYQTIADAVPTLLSAINALGKVIRNTESEEVFGGSTLSQLNTDYEYLETVVKG